MLLPNIDGIWKKNQPKKRDCNSEAGVEASGSKGKVKGSKTVGHDLVTGMELSMVDEKIVQDKDKVWDQLLWKFRN